MAESSSSRDAVADLERAHLAVADAAREVAELQVPEAHQKVGHDLRVRLLDLQEAVAEWTAASAALVEALRVDATSSSAVL